MRSTVTLTMKNGEKLIVSGYESAITEKINQARTNDGETAQLLRLELDRTPTGQYASVDPNEVVTVIGDLW